MSDPTNNEVAERLKLPNACSTPLPKPFYSLPWHAEAVRDLYLEDGTCVEVCEIRNEGGDLIASDVVAPNGWLVVTAANAHADLLAEIARLNALADERQRLLVEVTTEAREALVEIGYMAQGILERTDDSLVRSNADGIIATAAEWLNPPLAGGAQ